VERSVRDAGVPLHNRRSWSPGASLAAMHGLHTADQVRAAEAAMMRTVGDGVLMRRAAAGLAHHVREFLGATYGRRVVLLVGAGDNGGDAPVGRCRAAPPGRARHPRCCWRRTARTRRASPRCAPPAGGCWPCTRPVRPQAPAPPRAATPAPAATPGPAPGRGSAPAPRPPAGSTRRGRWCPGRTSSSTGSSASPGAVRCATRPRSWSPPPTGRVCRSWPATCPRASTVTPGRPTGRTSAPR
jgi:hypothetical protein